MIGLVRQPDTADALARDRQHWLAHRTDRLGAAMRWVLVRQGVPFRAFVAGTAFPTAAARADFDRRVTARLLYAVVTGRVATPHHLDTPAVREQFRRRLVQGRRYRKDDETTTPQPAPARRQEAA